MDADKIFAAIQKWHSEDRASTLRRTLELGDLIVNAVIATGLTEYEVIRRVIQLEGDAAYSVSSYNRAARMARVFRASQRTVLIEAGVSLDRCEILAGDAYDGRRRIKTISDIKAGKVVAPWSAIEGSKAERRRKSLAPHVTRSREDSTGNPDNLVFRIGRDGEIDDEAVLDALRCLVSRLGRERAVRLWDEAVKANKEEKV